MLSPDHARRESALVIGSDGGAALDDIRSVPSFSTASPSDTDIRLLAAKRMKTGTALGMVLALCLSIIMLVWSSVVGHVLGGVAAAVTALGWSVYFAQYWTFSVHAKRRQWCHRRPVPTTFHDARRFRHVYAAIMTAITAYLFVTFIIRLGCSSAGVIVRRLPASCDVDKGCIRMTTAAPVSLSGLPTDPLILRTSMTQIHSIARMALTGFQTYFSMDQAAYTHAVQVSPFWGLATDVGIATTCMSNGTSTGGVPMEAMVEIVAQQRMGVADWGTTTRLAAMLRAVLGSYRFPVSGC